MGKDNVAVANLMRIQNPPGQKPWESKALSLALHALLALGLAWLQFLLPLSLF